MNTIKAWVVGFVMFCSQGIFAQTKVQGRVIDQKGDPVPYANVIFEGTQEGTFSKDDGSFIISSKKNRKIVQVSFVGFVTQSIRLKSNDVKDLEIVLSEGEELSDVVLISKPKKALSKKENPAYKILQQIWKNKRVTSLKDTRAYEYQRHTSLELGLNKLDTLFLRKAFGDNYQSLTQRIADKRAAGRYSVPMYVTEKMEHTYADNQINKQRTDITAERTQGVDQAGFGLERVIRAFPEFDVYDSKIFIQNSPFVNPLAEDAYGVYSYVLSDSIPTDKGQRYTVHFFPRQDQDKAFQGSFEVSSPNYAIESIRMNTTHHTTVAFVRAMFIQKDFEQIDEKTSVLKSELYEGDFSVISKGDDEKGIYLKRNVNYSNYLLNQPKEADFYEQQTTKVKADQFAQSDEYWKELSKTIPLSSGYELVGEIRGNKKMNAYASIIEVLTSGYFSMGKYLQFGSIWEAYTSNSIEGSRLRANVRTFVTSDDRFRSYAFLAWGTKDKKWKYGLSGQYLLSREPRILVGAQYSDDNMQLGSILMQDDTNLRMQNPASFWFERGENYYMVRNKLTRLMADWGLLGSNLHFTLSGNYMHSYPAAPERFSIDFKDGEKRMPNYADAFLRFTTTYTPNREVYGYGAEQRHDKINKIFPTYSFRYTKGVSGFLDSAFDYHKVEGRVTYPLHIWNLGTFYPTIEVGKGFGKIPLTQLSPSPANQTYTIVPLTFMLLDYYDFINDSYFNMYFDHHFGGFILNRIPLLKKTKWRSLVFARGTYGAMSKTNLEHNGTNLVYNPATKIYWEYGFGIENMGYGNFRFIRLDFVWGSYFKNMNGTQNPRFGVRVSFMPNF